MSDVDRVVSLFEAVGKLVDVGRGSVQLRVLVYACLRGGVDVDTCASDLGLPPRSVVDAVQKLRRKGFLKRSGRKFYSVDGYDDVCSTLSAITEMQSEVLREFLKTYTLMESVLVLGSSGGKASLREVSRSIGVSEEEVAKVLSSTGVAVVSGGKAVLTENGWRLFEKGLRRLGLGPVGARVMCMLTRTKDPRRALTRFVLLYGLISGLVLWEATIPEGVFASILWLVASLVMAYIIAAKK